MSRPMPRFAPFRTSTMPDFASRPSATVFRAGRFLAVGLLALGTLGGFSTGSMLSAADGPPPGLGEIAATLPPLPRADGVVTFPLSADGPLAWRPVRDGGIVSASPDGALSVAYTIVPGTPAGAALLIRPGTLAELTGLTLRLRGERNLQVVVTLRDAAGVTYAFPASSVRPGGGRDHQLDFADLSYLAPASEAPDPGSFDPATAVMITLLDLAGFMGGEPVASGFAVESLRGVGAVSPAATAAVGSNPSAGAGAQPAATEVKSGYGASGASPSRAVKQRHAAAIAAEETFFATFVGTAKPDRSRPLSPLMIAWLADPRDGRTALLLGLNHLWLAAEGDRTNPRVIDHLMLSERFLKTALELSPEDRRIPSWLVPVRLSLAKLEKYPDATAALEAELLAAYREDPNFHSFSVAMLGFENAPGSPAFERGLAALRAADSGCGLAAVPGTHHDPTCDNQPHWPHNVEAFETFAADYELKAGHVTAARTRLELARSRPSYTVWPFRAEVEDRLSNLELYARLYADQDRGNDPPGLIFTAGAMCASCHRAGAATPSSTAAVGAAR